MSTASSAKDEGFVLLAVLWLLAFLAALSLTLTHVVRLDVMARTRLLHKVEAQLLADSFAEYLAGVAAREPTRATQSRGHIVSCRLANKPAEFSITDVAGLVDLNAAPRIVLEKLLKGVGVSLERSRSLSAAIIDFRDGDEVVSNGGAEAQQYAAARLPFAPKNAPFDTVSEIDQVFGMSTDLVQTLSPLLTVYARRPFVELTAAPDGVLRALGLDEVGNQRRFSSEFYEAGSAATLGHAFDITIGVTNGDGVVARRHAVIEIDPRAPRGFAYREWDLGFKLSDWSSLHSPSLSDCLAMQEEESSR